MILSFQKPFGACTLIAMAILHAPAHGQVEAEDEMSSQQWAAIETASDVEPWSYGYHAPEPAEPSEPLLLLTSNSLDVLRAEQVRIVPVNPVLQTRLEIESTLSLDMAARHELLFEYGWSRYIEFSHALDHAHPFIPSNDDGGHYELDRISKDLDWLRLPPFNVRVGIGVVADEGFYRGIDPRELVSVLTPADGVALFFSLRSAF
jgi:hypothetical protein